MLPLSVQAALHHFLLSLEYPKLFYFVYSQSDTAHLLELLQNHCHNKFLHNPPEIRPANTLLPASLNALPDLAPYDGKVLQKNPQYCSFPRLTDHRNKNEVFRLFSPMHMYDNLH